MAWFLTVLGTVCVLVGLRDIFRTLWHPTGFGSLARGVFRLTWRISKAGPWRRRDIGLAGPLALLGTLCVWTTLLVVGFALIYLPRMPAGFYFASPLQPEASSDLLASLYLSVVALATLGLGDIQPATPLLRVAVPFQALLGFLLLTAGISWILQLYPALIRRRALARQLTTMAEHDAHDVVAEGEASVAVKHLETVRAGLATVEMDLVQYAESYYFRETSREVSLAAATPYVKDLVDAGRRSGRAEVRQSAQCCTAVSQPSSTSSIASTSAQARARTPS